MELKQNQIGWRFWILWTLANFLGWAIGIGLIFILAMNIRVSGETSGEGAILFILLIGFPVCGGVLAGFAQWLVIRRYLSYVGWWSIANLIGWLVAGIAVLMSSGWSSDNLWSATLWALPNLVNWPVQWRILKRHSSQANSWIRWGAIIWIIGLVLSFIFEYFVIIVYLILIPISGGILVWILRDQNNILENNAV